MALAPLPWLAAYRANPDPRIAAINTLALALAGNGPCYPVYLYWIVGHKAWLALFALWVVPLYAAVPAIGRRWPDAAAFVLMGGSIANTTLYTLLFGTQAELQLFLLPCITLGLFFPHRRRHWAWLLGAVALLEFVALRHGVGGIVSFNAIEYKGLAALSEISVATLTWFLLALLGGATRADTQC